MVQIVDDPDAGAGGVHVVVSFVPALMVTWGGDDDAVVRVTVAEISPSSSVKVAGDGVVAGAEALLGHTTRVYVGSVGASVFVPTPLNDTV